MLHLVDTNILVYRHDPRFPAKQARARDLLRRGLESGEARLSHQSIVEFVAASTRSRPKEPPLLERSEALREAEALIAQFPVLHPVEGLLRLALRGVATYSLSWFDSHMWAYAEHYALPLLYSEDFQHDGLYGTVRTQNPFV